MNAEIVAGLIVKTVGAVFGAVLALIFIPPKTIAGFARRLVASLIFGVAFAPFTRDWAGFDAGWEGLFGAACLSSFISWGAMGVLTDLFRGRILRKWIERKLGIGDDGRAE